MGPSPQTPEVITHILGASSVAQVCRSESAQCQTHKGILQENPVVTQAYPRSQIGLDYSFKVMVPQAGAELMQVASGGFQRKPETAAACLSLDCVAPLHGSSVPQRGQSPSCGPQAQYLIRSRIRPRVQAGPALCVLQKQPMALPHPSQPMLGPSGFHCLCAA